MKKINNLFLLRLLIRTPLPTYHSPLPKKLSYESSHIVKEIFMNKRFGIISIALVIGMVLAGCASMQLESLDTAEGPRQVRQGEGISPSSITVWGIYKDGSRKTVTVNASNINFDKDTPGPQTVRIRVSGQEASFQTEVMALLSVSITTPTTATILKQGQAVNSWPGLVVRGEWDQMGTETIPAASLAFTGYSSDRLGRQTITVSYMGKTASFEVSVVAMTAIRVAAAPTKVDYLQGEALDLAGLRVVGVWEGIPEEQLSVAANEVTGFNGDNAGVQRLTVTKSGITTTFNVEVWGLTGIVLDAPPDKTTYTVGEQLNLAGIIVMGNYSGSTADKRKTEAVPLNQLTATGFNSSAVARNQRVTITVRGNSANFFVNIEAAPPAWPPAAHQPAPTGTWRISQGGQTATITFNADGTATQRITGSGSDTSQNFTWSTSGNRLTMTMLSSRTGEVLGTVIYIYGISGNMMTMQNEEETATNTWTRQ
jgi:hypothetical protein